MKLLGTISGISQIPQKFQAIHKFPGTFRDFANSLKTLREFANSLIAQIHCNIYKPTVLPVASSSLFFDLQVVTLLLGKYTLFARANLCYPTTRLCSYFSPISAAHLRVYSRTMGCKRSLTEVLGLGVSNLPTNCLALTNEFVGVTEFYDSP